MGVAKGLERLAAEKGALGDSAARKRLLALFEEGSFTELDLSLIHISAARMLRCVIARMYPERSTSVIKLMEAFRDCRLSAGLLVDKKGRKRRALLGIEAKLPARVSLSSFICPDTPDADWDYANQSHRPWIDQGKGKGAVHNEDFFTLFDQNIQTAAELCAAYHRCVTEGEPTDLSLIHI